MTKRIVYLVEIKRFEEEERASYSIEASIVLPILLSVIILFIVIALAILQLISMYYIGVVSAERSAHAWNNSHRDVQSGALLTQQYDSLYGNNTGMAIMHTLFSKSSELYPYTRNMEDAHTPTHIQEEKLQKTIQYLQNKRLNLFSGGVSYQPQLLGSSIISTLKYKKLESITTVTHRAYIAEPVEFLRNYQLIIYYKERLSHHSKGAETKQTGKEIIEKLAVY